MWTKTVNHAAAAGAEALFERADPKIDEFMQDVYDKVREFHQDYTNRLETGTYVIAGAIVAGIVLAAVILRTTSGS